MSRKAQPPIETNFVCPPIFYRNKDWQAWFSFHDEDNDLFGQGETEAAAVADLLANALYLNDEERVVKEILNMALAYWKTQQ